MEMKLGLALLFSPLMFTKLVFIGRLDTLHLVQLVDLKGKLGNSCFEQLNVWLLYMIVGFRLYNPTNSR